MQIDLDNPLCLDFIPRLELNGKTMRISHGCSVVYNPCLPDGMINELEAKWALEHYDLDISYGWMIFRAAFPWASKRRTEIKSLSFTMEQRSCRVPGHALTAMHRRHETIWLVSALSAARTVQPQSYVEAARKKNSMQLVPLYTLSRWRVILNGVSYSTSKTPMKCH